MSFDDDAHRYVLDGKTELLSVTTAIGLAFEGMLGEEYWNETARQRGKAVHHAIMLDTEGSLDHATVHPVVQPFFQAYQKFKREQDPEWIENESIVFHEDEGSIYSGTLDGLGFLRGPFRAKAVGFNVFDLADWKSGLMPWTVGMQLAAYRQAILRFLPPKSIVRRWALRLRDDGNYVLEEVSRWEDHRLHWHDFQAALRVATIRRRYHAGHTALPVAG